MPNIFCPGCHAANDSQSMECSQCGFVFRVLCPKCRYVNDVKNFACAMCGCRLRDVRMSLARAGSDDSRPSPNISAAGNLASASITIAWSAAQVGASASSSATGGKFAGFRLAAAVSSASDWSARLAVASVAGAGDWLYDLPSDSY